MDTGKANYHLSVSVSVSEDSWFSSLSSPCFPEALDPRTGPRGLFLSTLTCWLVWSSCWSDVVEISWVQLPCCVSQTLSGSRSSGLLALRLWVLWFLWWLVSLRDGDCCRCPESAGPSMATHSPLHMSTSVESPSVVKRDFFDKRCAGDMLSCGYKNTYLNYNYIKWGHRFSWGVMGDWPHLQ